MLTVDKKPPENVKIPSGTQVVKVPSYANGDENHPAVEYGFVMRNVREGDTYAFVRYWTKGFAGIELRTKSNSESTPVNWLVIKDTVPQAKVQDAINEIMKEG